LAWVKLRPVTYKVIFPKMPVKNSEAAQFHQVLGNPVRRNLNELRPALYVLSQVFQIFLRAILNSLRHTKYPCRKRVGKTKLWDESNFIAGFSRNGKMPTDAGKHQAKRFQSKSARR
jgi:hypothetical protein